MIEGAETYGWPLSTDSGGFGMDPFTIIFGGMSMLSGISGMAGSSKAHEQQERAQRAAWEEKIRAYQFNIGQTEQEIEQLKYVGAETRADVRREGGRFMRGQSAAMGASGAAVGVGTPLMAMTEAAESIERDVLRVTRLEEMEITKREEGIEFMEQEIDIHESMLGRWHKLGALSKPGKKKKSDLLG